MIALSSILATKSEGSDTEDEANIYPGKGLPVEQLKFKITFVVSSGNLGLIMRVLLLLYRENILHICNKLSVSAKLGVFHVVHLEVSV